MSLVTEPDRPGAGRRAIVAVLVALTWADSGSALVAPEPIFNGRDLAGWHVSATSHHGQTRAWRVEDGVLVGGQQPDGVGGILLTNRRYRDIEIELDVRLDFGCDSGLLLRSNEDGAAYQVMLDDLENGNVGGVYGEGIAPLEATPNRDWKRVWRRNDWNRVRARIEGVAPRIRVWINGTLITDWTDTANHAAGGAVEGAIGLQVHGGSRWVRGGRVRFRNLTVRTLD